MIEVYKKTISDGTLLNVEGMEPGTWINVIEPTTEEVEKIAKEAHIEPDFIRSVLDPDEKPRIEVENSTVLIIIKIPSVDEKSKIVTIPLGIIITQKNLITVSAQKSELLDDFLNLKVKDFYTTKKTRFALQIMRRANIYYQRYFSSTEKVIEDVEKSLLKSLKNEEIVFLLDLQKSLVFVTTAIISNDKVLEKILNGKVLKLYDEDEDLLEDIIIDNKQSIDTVKIYSDILNNTMDAYASIVSNNLNIVMKFLASVTIVLAVPSIVSSFYGMNIALPFQKSQAAFLYVILLSILLSGVAITIFIRKKYF